MAGSIVDKLLSGRKKRWSSVVWILLIVGIFVLPTVDMALQQYQEMGKLRAKMASRAELPNRTRMLADRVAQMQADMTGLEAALVPPESQSAFKQAVARTAREANCRIRSVRPGPMVIRPLEELISGSDAATGRPTKVADWLVEEQAASVSIQGTFADLVAFVETLDKEVRIVQIATLHLHPPPETNEELILDLNIKTFNLFRNRPG